MHRGSSATRITEDLYQLVRHQVHADSAEKVVALLPGLKGAKTAGSCPDAPVRRPTRPRLVFRLGAADTSYLVSGGRGIQTHGDVAATMVFKWIRGSRPAAISTCFSPRPDGLPNKIIPRISRDEAVPRTQC